MPRSIPLIVGVSIFVIIGVCLASVIVLRTNAIEQTAISPVTLKFSCNETPTSNDFQQFWSNFRGAVKTNDKDTLYSLTTGCGLDGARISGPLVNFARFPQDVYLNPYWIG